MCVYNIYLSTKEFIFNYFVYLYCFYTPLCLNIVELLYVHINKYTQGVSGNKLYM